jgi:phosphoglycolate phosphatase
MIKKIIIFDFDGTIADSMGSFFNILNRLAKEFGYRKVEKNKIEELRNKKTEEFLKHLKIPLLKLSFIVNRVLLELNKEIEFLKPIKGVKKTLSVLKNKGYILCILTSNSKDNVNLFLKKHGFCLFKFIYSGSSVFGKTDVLRKVLKEHHLQSDEVIYVGDETRDIEAAKKAKVKAVAVTWGFNTRKILKKFKPNYIINKPNELLNIL